MNYYAITIKKTTEYVISLADLKKDYEDWLTYAATCGLIMEKYCYEFDPKGLLHLHGIVRAKSNFYKKRVLKKGFHQHIEKLETQDDIVKWMIYIHKDHENKFLSEQLLIEQDPEYQRQKAQALYNNSIRHL